MSSYLIGKRTPQLGDLLRLKIVDHAMSSGDFALASHLEFEVSGVLVRETALAYIISGWRMDDPTDDNSEWLSILKCAIVQGFGYPPPKYTK